MHVNFHTWMSALFISWLVQPSPAGASGLKARFEACTHARCWIWELSHVSGQCRSQITYAREQNVENFKTSCFTKPQSSEGLPPNLCPDCVSWPQYTCSGISQRAELLSLQNLEITAKIVNNFCDVDDCKLADFFSCHLDQGTGWWSAPMLLRDRSKRSHFTQFFYGFICPH